MEAVICPKYGSPEVLQLQEVNRPMPRDNEVQIKVKATTVAVADCRIRGFDVPRSFWLPARLGLGIMRPRMPIIGIELSGEIEMVGKNVSSFKKGDRVFGASVHNFGAYAQYKCLPTTVPIAQIPDNVSFEEAAAIPIGARTALHYIRRAKVSAGKKVLIYGASGSVGTYAVQIAKHFGAEVTGVCSSPNTGMVTSLGAHKVVDYTTNNWTQQLEQYDVILLAIDKWPFDSCKQFLKEDGTYLNVTQPFKNLSMMWTSLTTNKKVIMGENPSKTSEDLQYLKQLIESGAIKPVIDRKYTLKQIVEAHRYVDKGHKKGNVVITVH